MINNRLSSMFYAKTVGTNFNGFVILPINVTELVTEDVRM